MGQTITPEIEKRALELVAQMTLEEKLAYIGGYNGFFIRPIPRLGIPEIRMADGPQGVRNDTHSTMYPCGIAAAATWNRELARTYGHSLGQDARGEYLSLAALWTQLRILWRGSLSDVRNGRGVYRRYAGGRCNGDDQAFLRQ